MAGLFLHYSAFLLLVLKREQSFWRHWDIPDPACIWEFLFLYELKMGFYFLWHRRCLKVLTHTHTHSCSAGASSLRSVMVNRWIKPTDRRSVAHNINGRLNFKWQKKKESHLDFFGVFSAILWFWVLGQWQIVWCSNYLGCEMTWVILWFASYKLNITSN